MQRRVVTPICGIYTRAPLHQHFDDFQMTLLGSPMQRTESVIVSETNNQNELNGKRTTRLYTTCPWFMSCSVSSNHTRTCMATPSRHHWNMSSISVKNTNGLERIVHGNGTEIGLDRSCGCCWKSYAQHPAARTTYKHTKFGVTKINTLISFKQLLSRPQSINMSTAMVLNPVFRELPQ